MSVKLESRFSQIAREIEPKVSRATRVGAEMIASAAKARAPVRTGALRSAIHVEFKGDADWAVVAGDSKVFYGHMVEFGTTTAGAQPFLIPALESSKRGVEAAVAKALRSL